MSMSYSLEIKLIASKTRLNIIRDWMISRNSKIKNINLFCILCMLVISISTNSTKRFYLSINLKIPAYFKQLNSHSIHSKLDYLFLNFVDPLRTGAINMPRLLNCLKTLSKFTYYSWKIGNMIFPQQHIQILINLHPIRCVNIWEIIDSLHIFK